MNFQATFTQLRTLWTGLTGTQKASILLAALVVAGGVSWFTIRQTRTEFRAAFTGMSAEDAGAIVAKLKESATEYQISENGGSVLVPAARVAEVRLQMAAAGLPRTGRIGFELFDKTNLTSTDFAEQVNYRRALEGELERSIRSIAEVEQARVHLSPAKDSVFTDSREPAKASVLLTLRSGAQVTEGNVRAIVHLVASAVEGLTPQLVSVTDSKGNLLNRPKKPQSDGEASDELIEFRQKVERDLTSKVVSTLEPLLGAGKFRVGMSVDCDFSSGEQSEELYDPDKSVMVSTQKSEETSGSAGSAGGVPGTSTNLPRPATRAGNGSGGTTRRTENVTYQTSHTVRRTRLPQGTVRRISVSVLLDQGLRWELRNGRQNRILVPPTEESMQGIREVVSATVGLVPNRGDQLVVRSLPFETTLSTPPPPVPVQAAPGAGQRTPQTPVEMLMQDWRLMSGAAGAVLLIAIVAVALVVRSRKKRARAAAAAAAAAAAIKAAAALPAGATPEETAAIAAATEAGAIANSEEATRLLAQAKQRVIKTVHIETISEKLRAGINTDSALAASVLRSWLDEGERIR